MARWNVKSNIKRQIECPYYVSLVYFQYFHLFIPHQASGMTNKPAAKHQRSRKSLKIKYKAFKEFENGTPPRVVASLFGVPEKTLSTPKTTKKKFSIRMKVALELKE